jgi:hypothetical protein
MEKEEQEMVLEWWCDAVGGRLADCGRHEDE